MLLTRGSEKHMLVAGVQQPVLQACNRTFSGLHAKYNHIVRMIRGTQDIGTLGVS